MKFVISGQMFVTGLTPRGKNNPRGLWIVGVGAPSNNAKRLSLNYLAEEYYSNDGGDTCADIKEVLQELYNSGYQNFNLYLSLTGEKSTDASVATVTTANLQELEAALDGTTDPYTWNIGNYFIPRTYSTSGYKILYSEDRINIMISGSTTTVLIPFATDISNLVTESSGLGGWTTSIQANSYVRIEVSDYRSTTINIKNSATGELVRKLYVGNSSYMKGYPSDRNLSVIPASGGTIPLDVYYFLNSDASSSITGVNCTLSRSTISSNLNAIVPANTTGGFRYITVENVPTATKPKSISFSIPQAPIGELTLTPSEQIIDQQIEFTISGTLHSDNCVLYTYTDTNWTTSLVSYTIQDGAVSGTLYVNTTGYNLTDAPRTANIYVSAYLSNNFITSSSVQVTQEVRPVILITPETKSVSYISQSDSVSVSYIGSGTLSTASNVDWIKNLVINGDTLTFDIEENPGDVRTGIITVTDGTESATCTVEQSYTEVIASNITVNKPTDLNIPKTNQILDLDWTATGTSNKKNTYTEVTSETDWITVSCPSLSTSDLIYTLNPTGSLTVTANTGEERVGIITLKVFTDGNLVASEEIMITQESNIQLKMSGDKITRTPEAYTFPSPWNITYNGSKKLSYKVDSDWITIDNINENPVLNYYSQVTCSVIENSNPTTRMGTLTVSEIDGNLTVSATITQWGNIIVEPSELDIPQTGASGSVSVQTDQISNVFLSVDQDWITASLDGNVLNYSVTENPTEETRTGNIKLEYKTYSSVDYTKIIPVTQSGIIPELTIDPVSKTVTNDSGSFEVVINYTGSKNLSRFTDSDWLTFDGNTISYTENTGIDTRTSKATITDGTISAICTVVQTGVAVTLILEPDILEVDKNQHSGSLDIIYNGRDNLVVTSSSWITSVLVNDKINYTITSNPGTSRTGFIQVTDGNLTAKCTVIQTDQDTILKLDPNSISVTYAEYTGSLNIIYTGKNDLTVSSQQHWINPSIEGNTVKFTITANELESDRIGYIQVSDGNLSEIASVRQYAKTDHPTIAILELEQSIDSKGGELLNTVISVGDVGEITVKSQDSWVLVDINDHTIKAVVSQNDSQARQAVITVSTEKANSVSYVINQKGVARDYIYFESGTKQIDYKGGIITNKLITNGTDPKVTCDASWVVVNPDFTVTVATNSDKSDRQAVVTGTSSVGTAMYTIYQAGNTTEIPIWRTTEYSEQTDESFLEYHIDSNDKVLYAGKVYVYPDSDTARFCINDIVSNYLTVMPFPEDIGNTYYGDWKKTFKIVTSSGESEEYTFYNDWSYNEDGHLNNKIVDYRQPFIISGTNMYFSIGSLRFDVYGTYRLDLNGLYPCGTPIEVYQNDSLIKTYEIDSTKKNYVIYWANKFGGWDFLPIRGNDMRTDQIESNKYSLLDRYIYYDTKYQSTIKPSWKLYTGWMKGNISDLVESVDVRLYDLNKQVFYKVLITDSQAEYRTYRNNGNRLVSYEINCEMSNQYIRK